jgi:hypothetical protein
MPRVSPMKTIPTWRKRLPMKPLRFMLPWVVASQVVSSIRLIICVLDTSMEARDVRNLSKLLASRGRDVTFLR